MDPIRKQGFIQSEVPEITELAVVKVESLPRMESILFRPFACGEPLQRNHFHAFLGTRLYVKLFFNATYI